MGLSFRGSYSALCSLSAPNVLAYKIPSPKTQSQHITASTFKSKISSKFYQFKVPNLASKSYKSGVGGILGVMHLGAKFSPFVDL